MKRLKTADDVMRVLSVPLVMEMTGANSKQVWNWTGRFGMFPANVYVVMIRALNRRGYTAPARLWNMKGLENEAA